MVDDESINTCLKFFENIQGRGKRKSFIGFDESLAILQDVASTRGLNDMEIDTILKSITGDELRIGMRASLVKCLIPQKAMPENYVHKLIHFWLAECNELPVTLSTIIVQWLIGLWEYQLTDRQAINIYYDCFFFNMLKLKKIEPFISRLIYLLTKPDDVTRRQVLRLQRLQNQYSKPQKHISALMSLFKSYKPELVPEKVLSVNIESAWKPIPEELMGRLESAKTRGNIEQAGRLQVFDWNTIKTTDGKNSEPLLPSIRYFQMGSSIYKDRDTKFLFDLSNIEDIGKYYFNVELPANATSLLANTAGYHFLTFANYEYQSRFSHNLYNTLRRAFIIESSRFTHNQKQQLLEMTREFCRYMQQGIPVVFWFLQEYIPIETGEFRSQILGLLEWSTFITPQDLQDMTTYLDTIFLESTIEEKCQIIRCLQNLGVNLFVYQKYGESPRKPSPFLGQETACELGDIIPILIEISDHLIVKGLNIHNNHLCLLAEALTFYETINKLSLRCNPPLLIMASSPVIYNSFLSKSCPILARVCSLLLTYRKICQKLIKMNLHGDCEAQLNALQLYARDLVRALWYDNIFSNRDESPMLHGLPNEMTQCLPDSMDTLLNISNHIAILPYKCTLSDGGLDISSKLAGLTIADNYYPSVSQLIRVFFKDSEAAN